MIKPKNNIFSIIITGSGQGYLSFGEDINYNSDTEILKLEKPFSIQHFNFKYHILDAIEKRLGTEVRKKIDRDCSYLVNHEKIITTQKFIIKDLGDNLDWWKEAKSRNLSFFLQTEELWRKKIRESEEEWKKLSLLRKLYWFFFRKRFESNGGMVFIHDF